MINDRCSWSSVPSGRVFYKVSVIHVTQISTGSFVISNSLNF